jgi:hypothetical protein
MLEVLALRKRFLMTGTALACLLTANLIPAGSSSSTEPEVPLPFIVGSNEKLLDQIFEEEKSNRICRFMKIRKMKV